MSKHSPTLEDHFRKGGWLPASDEVLQEWLDGVVNEATQKDRMIGLLPEVQELKDMIENDGDLYMGFHRMFEGVKSGPKDYETLCVALSDNFRKPPYHGPIGPPIYMILFQAMNTQGGFTTFLTEKLNKQLKKIFDAWAKFLDSEASCSVLNSEEGGWFSPKALQDLEVNFNGLKFADIFVCDPKAQHWGFKSWDDFFNRRFRPGVRAVELPDQPNVVNAACESVLYNIKYDVKDLDTFWIKGEPYSLLHMLNHDKLARQFISGTILQGFLAVTGYHRWQSPVAGVIKKIVLVPGTYFVQSPATLGEGDNPYLRSLSFITSLTTRMLIFIESDNPLIGLMCFIAIGMTEVSTCEATVREGQRVQRGDELGMFHFGGSSHCLVFRPETKIQFDNFDDPRIRVRAAIGVVQ